MADPRDLSDVIAENLAAREQRATGPDAAALARTVAAVRRRRVRRRAGEVSAVVGVAAALVVAVAVTADHRAAPDPAGPTPTVVTPAPTGGPTPDATAAPFPSQTEISAGLGLPAGTREITDDVWDQVGPGWAVAVYRPAWDDGVNLPTLRQTLVLASPTGDVYRLHELPDDRLVDVHRWEAGTTRVMVEYRPEDGTGEAQPTRGRLDLRTGEIEPVPSAAHQRPDDGCHTRTDYRGTDADGDELWAALYCQTGGGGPSTWFVQRPDGTAVRTFEMGWRWSAARLDPTGRRLVAPADRAVEKEARDYHVVDLATGESTAYDWRIPDRDCALTGWFTADDLLVACRTGGTPEELGRLVGPGDELWTVPATGGEPTLLRTLATDEPYLDPDRGVHVSDGVVAITGARTGDECTSGPYLLDATGSRPLDAGTSSGVLIGGVLDGVVHATVWGPCVDGMPHTGAASLVAWDGDGREVLLPEVHGPASLTDGLTSWALAGGPSLHGWS